MGYIFITLPTCKKALFYYPERWVSGLNQQFAKLPYAFKAYRGFKSLSLRRIPATAGFFIMPYLRYIIRSEMDQSFYKGSNEN